LLYNTLLGSSPGQGVYSPLNSKKVPIMDRNVLTAVKAKKAFKEELYTPPWMARE
jgi:hypothetical protein